MPSNHLPCYLSSKYEVSPNLRQSLDVCCNQRTGTPCSGNRILQCKQYPPELLSLNPLAFWPLYLCDAEPWRWLVFLPKAILSRAKRLKTWSCKKLASPTAFLAKSLPHSSECPHWEVTVFLGVIWLDLLEFFMDHLILLGISDAWDTCNVSVWYGGRFYNTL